MRAARSTLMAAMLVVVALAIAPSVGKAAQAVPALQSLRAGMGSTSQGGQPILSITGRLPDSVPLPATIVIPFPNGLTPSWVGEIAGADPSKDPTAKYAIKTGPQFSTMTITLTQNRTGQAEFGVQTSVANGGTQYAADLPILGKVGEVTIELRVPAGSAVTSLSPGVVLTTTSGGIDIYAITKKSPKVGSTFSAALLAGAAAPAAGSAPAGSAATGSLSELAAIPVIALSALLGFIGVHLFQSSKEKRAALAASGDGLVDPPAPHPTPAPARNQPASSKKAAKRAAREREEAAALAARSSAAAIGAGEAFGEDDEEEPGSESIAEPEPEVVFESPQPDEEFDGESDEDLDSDEDDDEEVKAGDEADMTAGRPSVPAGDIVGQIKELVALKASGALDPDEFAAAKQSLLEGETRVVALLEDLSRFERDDLLSSEEFALAKAQLLTGPTEMIVGIEDLAELERQGLLSRDEFRVVVDRLLEA